MSLREGCEVKYSTKENPGGPILPLDLNPHVANELRQIVAEWLRQGVFLRRHPSPQQVLFMADFIEWVSAYDEATDQ